MHAPFTARRLAAAGIAAAFAASSALLAVPAAAQSAPINYTCTLPVLGAKTFAAVFDTDAPATLVGTTASAPLNGAGSLTIPGDLVDTIRGLLSATKIDGAVTKLTTTAGGATKESANLAIAPVEVPTAAGTPMTLNIVGPLGYSVPVSPAGNYDIVAGAFTSHLNFYNAAGDPIGTGFDIPCTPDAGQNLLVDRVAVTAPTPTPTPTPAPTPTPTPTPVVKVDTKTTVKAKYVKAKKKITAKIRVKGTDDTPGTGTVKIKVKLGKKTITKLTKKLSSNGTAKAVIKRIRKKGKYKLTVAYGGSDTQNRSRGKDTVRVR